jgi:hypothetical protein
MKVAFIIPACDERETIAEIVRRVQSLEIGKRIIGLDDGGVTKPADHAAAGFQPDHT